MANSNYVYCGNTAVRNHRIPFPTSEGGEEQQQLFVNGGPHYQCDYFAGPQFPGSVGAEMMKLWSSCVNDQEAENGGGVHEANIINNQVDVRRKKTKLTSEQVEALEKSFQEDIQLEQQTSGSTIQHRKNRVKLEPERKLKLSKELGLHPRQVATGFQNRRARLKGKQIEQLYSVLKKDYEVVLRENQHLHQEVMELKEKLDGCRSKQASTANMEYGSLLQAEYNKLVDLGNSKTKISERDNYLFNDEVDYYSTASFPYGRGVSSEYP
ncbi:homeobox-leucine zipper protein ATHB-22-like [Papaver somniferum]|uniref:homeobox-leucine zipper protein ATHB-22-like n=1 Tax=Papaver somniferum TaxID=3469 RepID=UPI000E6F7DAC|nr:homeobox-leucine zipper protein ATHB-22-like [Papaver somniferum]